MATVENEMNILSPQRFPMLRAATRKPERLDAAIESIAEGTAVGAIRNVTLNDAKSLISRAVDDAWKLHVSDPFFCAGRWESQPMDIQELNDSLSVYGLHDVISASKKIGKSKATGAALEAMRLFVAEVLPLALAVADLKDKVVKGRAPSSTPAKPANPNKIIKTCPVCFRPIAVQALHMVHHGYQRPGIGFQTASCPGIRFKPLEVSSEGLEWLISTLRLQLQESITAYDSRDTKESLQVFIKGRNASKSNLETVTRSSSNWARHFGSYVSKLESEIASLNNELKHLNKKLLNWKPE